VKLVMTLLVRDEEDIVEANLDFHLNQGVDFIIVTDNGSEDSTRQMIEYYEQKGLVEIIDEPEDNYAQGRWVTRMARLAASKYDADWVINNDADEFWVPTKHPNLNTALDAVEDGYTGVSAERRNFIPRPENGQMFYDRMIIREKESRNPLGEPLPPKVCHRADKNVVVGEGNHTVKTSTGGSILEDGRIEILHFPQRSYKQFQNNIVKSGRAYGRNRELSQKTGHAKRWLYQLWVEGQLEAYYNAKTLSRYEILKGLMQGKLTYDTYLRRFFRQRLESP